MARVNWKQSPDRHDYPAAASYLSLLVDDPALRDAVVAAFAEAPIATYKAKDLLRASLMPLLPVDNPHVASDLRKVRKGRSLSPVLLVRGDLLRGFPLQIADGYHRVCASYHLDENTDIPCRVVDVPLPVGVPSALPAVVTAATAAAKKAPAKKVTAKKAPAKKVAPKKAPAKKVAAKKAPAKKVTGTKVAVKRPAKQPAKQPAPIPAQLAPTEAVAPADMNPPGGA
jgi:hypothetical protein